MTLTHLVNMPTTDPYLLASGYRWVQVCHNQTLWYCSYYSESKDRKYAVKKAKSLLQNYLGAYWHD